MRLRTLTGTRFPAKCADGCGTEIPASPDVKVVVDFESRPRKTWVPAHSPDAGTWRGGQASEGRVLPREPGPGPSAASPGSGSLGPDAGSWKGNGSTTSPNAGSSTSQPSNGGNGHATGFVPASALPPSPPKAPDPPAQPSGPTPVPLALLGSAAASEPSPSATVGVPWATSSLTFNAGSYESAKSGFADYSRPGETAEQLRERVNRVVLEDLEGSVRAMRELHERLGDTPARTTSPARAAGTPSGVSSPPRMIVPSASPTVEEASPGHSPSAVGAGPGPAKAPAQNPDGERPLKELVREVSLELSDTSIKRMMAKEKVWVGWLQNRGYASLKDVRMGDEWGLGRVLDEFEAIDRKG